jgi:RHS repeat-associated protein
MRMRNELLRTCKHCVLAAVAVYLVSTRLFGAEIPGLTLTPVTIPTPRTVNPYRIGPGSNGRIWFTDVTFRQVGFIAANGTINAFRLIDSVDANNEVRPLAITEGPDGNGWFTLYVTNSSGSPLSRTGVGRVTPTGTITIFPTPTGDACVIFGGAHVCDITVGPDGNLWFTETQVKRIGKITPSGQITEYLADGAGGEFYYGITAGPDGNLWVADAFNSVVRITPAGVITFFDRQGMTVNNITGGADGNVWFTDSASHSIGRITPTGVITLFPTPTPMSVPFGIAAGSDGKLYFTEASAAAPKLGQIDPVTGLINESAVAGRGQLRDVVALTGGSSGLIGIAAPGDVELAVQSTNPPQEDITKATITTGGGGPPTTRISTANRPNAGTEPQDPVNTTTGELYEQMRPDIQLRGPLPLFLARYYASRLTSDGNVASALGTNWSHNFDWSVKTPDANTVNVVTARGRVYAFTKSGNNFSLQSPLYVPVQLIQNASGFVFGNPLTEMIYTFNTSGRLTRIDDTGGNSLTLTYAGNNLTQVSDGIGRTLSFAYVANHLTSVSDGPRTVRYTYADNTLGTYTDALGKTTTYAYDAGGLLRTTTQPRGNVRYAQTFDSSGRVASQTSNGTNTTTLSYAAASTTVTDPTAATRIHGHNTTAGGELTSAADEAGQGVQLGYDAAGRRTSITDRLGDASRLSYHPQSSKIAERIEADGARTAFSFGSRTSSGINLYPVMGVTYPDGTIESFVRDGNGNVTSRTDRAGKVWTFTHNSRSQLLTATNPTAGVTTSSYNADGTLATLADSDTGVTAFTYDAVRRPIRIARPDGSTMQMEYDANDRVTAITDELGRRFTYAYDANDNLSQITDPASRSAQFAYDALDRAVQITDRLGAVSRRTFDQRELLATIVDRNNNTVRFTRDSRRRVTALTDAGGKAWTFGYDNEAVRNSITNPLNQTSSRSTNKLGRTMTVSDALGNTAGWTRDSMQRVTSISDPLSRMTSFTYDSRGLLSGMTRPSVGTANYTRNDLGLIASIRDLKGETWQRLYTPIGRLQSMRDPLGRSTSYGYDNRGRLSSIALPDGVQQTHTYDASSNLTRAAFTGGPDHSYAYDSLNRLTSTTGLTIGYDAEGRPTSTVTNGVTSAATFDAGGRLTNVTYNNGAFSVLYEYDARDLLTRVSDTFTNTHVTFGYDDASRLTQISRPSGVNTTYTYDAAGRLIRIQDGTILDLQYTLNANGEPTREDSLSPLDAGAGASGVPSATFNYDAASQIASGGYASDARGRLTNFPGHTYRWDGVSRLVGIDNINLTYDGLGNILSSGTTNYFYNVAIGMNPILAEGNGPTMTRAYVWTPGGALVYSIDIPSRTVAHYHFDRIGSTVAMTDNGGAVTNAYAYDPYGVSLGRTGSSTQPFTYVGRWGVRAEPAAGLYHMRARYYDPSTARFLSRDPMRSLEPQEINPYQYARNSPTTRIDPNGRDSYGVSVGAKGGGFFGAEFDFGFDPSFFEESSMGRDSEVISSPSGRINDIRDPGGFYRSLGKDIDEELGPFDEDREDLRRRGIEGLRKAALFLTGVRELDPAREAEEDREEAFQERLREDEERERAEEAANEPIVPMLFGEPLTGPLCEDIFAGIAIDLDQCGSPKSTRESVKTNLKPPTQSGLADDESSASSDLEEKLEEVRSFLRELNDREFRKSIKGQLQRTP